MSLEVLNTLGTLVTVVIVATTAIAALVQLRHLRASNEISALLTVAHEFQSNAFRESLHQVDYHLARMLGEPLFREYAASVARNLKPPDVGPEYVEVRRAAVLIGNASEELGLLIKHRTVDKDLFLDRYSTTILHMWARLTPFVAFVRAASGDPARFENFEYLVVCAQDWEREHPSSYPQGVRHLEIDNALPVPPMPASA